MSRRIRLVITWVCHDSSVVVQDDQVDAALLVLSQLAVALEQGYKLPANVIRSQLSAATSELTHVEIVGVEADDDGSIEPPPPLAIRPPPSHV